MAVASIPLGRADDLEILFAYPNIPGSQESLPDTIAHWISQTLTRDGISGFGIDVATDGDTCTLTLDGPSDDENAMYAQRIPAILKLGLEAWQGPIQQIKQRQVWGTDNQCYPMWDPNGTGRWRFFLTLGVGLVNHRTLQFFHYPPERLLNPLRDSMQDPVTFRCRDLLVANGVSENETHFYETRINSTPIAAPDDQGTNTSAPADPVWGGLIPIGYFRSFEAAMIQTLLKPHPKATGYTIPMTAYGKDPRQRLGGMFLNPDEVVVIEAIPGLRTPVLGSNHPYRFYYEAQASDGKSQVGSGVLLPNALGTCIELQQVDLAVVRWQCQMAQDPSQDPWQAIREAKEFWKSPDQQHMVNALVLRHGTLRYEDPDGYHFGFTMSLEEALSKTTATHVI
ncbi:MAG: hypothetical protein KDA96_18010 [Planctomycetaceae bacterium]|nr:hypothetical protein [Planctomycetaceae bacterium]